MAVVDLDLQEVPEADFSTSLALEAIKMNPEGGPVLFIVGSGPGVTVYRNLREKLPFETAGLVSAVLSTSEEISSLALNSQPDLVVGIGGGAVIDRGKLAAKTAGSRYLAAPTALSQDGLYAEHAVLRTALGGVERFRCSPPDKVLPAVEMIEGAPDNFRSACVGDLLSNINAIEDCHLAEASGRYVVPANAIELASKAAEIATLSDPDGSPMELFDAIQLSGKAMMVAEGSTPCSGAEHKIDHALNLVTGRSRSHGLTVGLATAFLVALRSPDRLAELVQTMHRHRLPTELAELGVSESEFVEAVGVACDLRPSRYTILNHYRPSKSQIVEALDELAKQKVASL